jgi:hypothetical protein
MEGHPAKCYSMKKKKIEKKPCLHKFYTPLSDILYKITIVTLNRKQDLI